MKKQTKKQLDKIEKKRLNKLWKETRLKVLDRDKNMCVICGATNGNVYINKRRNEVKTKLDVHHILEKEFLVYKYLQFDERNLITVCSRCHKYSWFSFHKCPLLALNVLKTIYPKNYSFLLNEVLKLYAKRI
jgi:5-methylcytosine-specific restriction endonuclease McrA